MTAAADMEKYRSRFFTDEDLDRLKFEHPHLRGGRCPTCSDRGVYRWQGEDHECDCDQQIHLHKHYLSAGIGVTYQRLTWADYNEGKIDTHVEKLIKYAENPMYLERGIGLIFTGGYGVGKTMLAALTLKAFVRQGYQCFSTLYANAMQMHTSGFGDRKAQDLFKRKVMSSEILLIDDLGREQASKITGSTLDLVLRSRVQYGRPTLITTNLTPEELENGVIRGVTSDEVAQGGAYGAAVLSLLREKSSLHSFEGTDFRTRANQRELEEIEKGEVRKIV